MVSTNEGGHVHVDNVTPLQLTLVRDAVADDLPVVVSTPQHSTAQGVRGSRLMCGLRLVSFMHTAACTSLSSTGAVLHIISGPVPLSGTGP